MIMNVLYEFYLISLEESQSGGFKSSSFKQGNYIQVYNKEDIGFSIDINSPNFDTYFQNHSRKGKRFWSNFKRLDGILEVSSPFLGAKRRLQFTLSVCLYVCMSDVTVSPLSAHRSSEHVLVCSNLLVVIYSLFFRVL